MLPNRNSLIIINKYILKFKNNNYTITKKLKHNLINELIKNNYLIKTEDNTYTLISEDCSEMMHSNIGALKESIEKFVIPSNVDKLEKPKILDLCSGIGYNSIGALHFNKNCNIDMIEYSKETLFLSLCLDIPLTEHNIVKKAILNYFKYEDNSNNNSNSNSNNSNNNSNNIKIFIGDGRNIVKKLDKNTYNIIFHDGFSPQRDSVLYTVDFLKILYELLKDNGVLLSYSSSIPFRSSLIKAGFIVGEGKAVGRKRGITLAYKNPTEKLIKINKVDERLIGLSTLKVPYRDKNLNLTHNEIIYNRDLEREKLKKKLININKYYSTKQIKLGKIPNIYLEIQNNKNLNSNEIIKLMEKINYY